MKRQTSNVKKIQFTVHRFAHEQRSACGACHVESAAPTDSPFTFHLSRLFPSSIVAFAAIPLLICLILCARSADAGRFAGKNLRVDTHIGNVLSPINDGQTTLPTLLSGETFQIELFLEDARSLRVRGFTLAFDNSDNRFGEHFRIVKIEGILPQEGLPGPTSISAGNNLPATISPSDYLATITFSARRDLPSGLQLRFDPVRTRILDDVTGDADTLRTASAVVTFGQPPYSLFLDLDTSPGNQRLTQSFGNRAGQPVALQVFGEAVKFTTGFILRFEFDSTQLAFTAFAPGDLLPGVQTLAPILTQLDSPNVAVEVTAASFAGAAAADNGLLGTLTFLSSSEFSGTAIRLTAAEIRRGGAFLPFTTPLSVELLGLNADFNNDGAIDFRDFLLFAERFGARRSDPHFNARFDLFPDGVINFADFVLFVESLTTFRVIVLD